MNYEVINTAILDSQDTPKTINRDDKFYNYLLDNSVAYYYSKHISKEKTEMDKKIIAAGDILNKKFLKTMKLVLRICKENNIRFLLFKTYKYFSEVVDNDIDLIIKENDFYNFIKALQREGFTCLENEHLKAICFKQSFCKIEPRINSSFRGLVIFDEKKIWEKPEWVNIDRIKILKTAKEIDLLHQLLGILYNPNYLKLYLLLLYKDANIKKLDKLILNKQIDQDLKFLIKNLIPKSLENRRFPLFIGNSDFIGWWFTRIFQAPDFSLQSKLRLLIFFFYSKYLFLFFNRLVFKHKWPLQKIK